MKGNASLTAITTTIMRQVSVSGGSSLKAAQVLPSTVTNDEDFWDTVDQSRHMELIASARTAFDTPSNAMNIV